MQCGPAIGRREVIEHLLDERRLEHRVRRADPDAGLREAELYLAPVHGVEHPIDVSVLDQPADSDRHRRRGHPHVLGEVREHRRRLGVEVVHDAHLSRAHERRRVRVAHVAPVAGEVDAGVIPKDLGDVVAEAHVGEDDDDS